MTDGISAAYRHSRTLTEKDFEDAKLNKIDRIIVRELEQIKNYPHWVCALWTPGYEKKRRKELLLDIGSKNSDIEYISTWNGNRVQPIRK